MFNCLGVGVTEVPPPYAVHEIDDTEVKAERDTQQPLP